MIFGEPGLAKDTIASLIHFGSPARREAMVRLDCARPDGGLSELFGRGQKKGLLHWLQDGTLLLTNWHQVGVQSPLPLQPLVDVEALPIPFLIASCENLDDHVRNGV